MPPDVEIVECAARLPGPDFQVAQGAVDGFGREPQGHIDPVGDAAGQFQGPGAAGRQVDGHRFVGPHQARGSAPVRGFGIAPQPLHGHHVLFEPGQRRPLQAQVQNAAVAGADADAEAAPGELVEGAARTCRDGGMPGHRVGDEAADLAMRGIEGQQRQGHVLIAQQRRRISGTDQAETGLFGLGDPTNELVLALGLAGYSKGRHSPFTPGSRMAI